MKKEDHLKIDKTIFGKEYKKVHEWLDSTFFEYAKHPIPYLHWLKHHHMEAIREKYGSFTNEFNVAYVHIMCDFIHHFKMSYIPRDMNDLLDTFIALGILQNDGSGKKK